eukprot:TRINITY_DN1689_c0_g1_i1.p1 TRINITY_DN1689_c0_g1~~TRINITY_DN1689_c0_g1_i1.p1  ORF type:complete len:350 (+),score=62.84 TRINITY_DN1689_c0_g1_i1:137-1186(+)
MRTTVVKTLHDDFVHDIAYDYYGKRLATCSSDHYIKIWDQNNKGEWKMSAAFQAHSGSVQKLCWAHPEFGQVLASCSSDYVVTIWEEQVDGKTGLKSWKKAARFVDSKDSVQDIQFAPRHVGLKLAAASRDGKVRTYEATNVLNLSHWSIVEEFEAGKKDCHCLSWNPSPFDSQMLAVGCQSSVKIWALPGNTNKWQIVAELDGFNDILHDVEWAPNMGRSYHLIASACKDKVVRIHKLFVAQNKYQTQLVAQLTEHKAEVWRVSWNLTGTILASTGDDCKTWLWKTDFTGKWRPAFVATPSGDLEEKKEKDSASSSKSLTSSSSSSLSSSSSSSTSSASSKEAKEQKL